MSKFVLKFSIRGNNQLYIYQSAPPELRENADKIYIYAGNYIDSRYSVNFTTLTHFFVTIMKGSQKEFHIQAVQDVEISADQVKHLENLAQDSQIISHEDEVDLMQTLMSCLNIARQIPDDLSHFSSKNLATLSKMTDEAITQIALTHGVFNNEDFIQPLHLTSRCRAIFFSDENKINNPDQTVSLIDALLTFDECIKVALNTTINTQILSHERIATVSKFNFEQIFKAAIHLSGFTPLSEDTIELTTSDEINFKRLCTNAWEILINSINCPSYLASLTYLEPVSSEIDSSNDFDFESGNNVDTENDAEDIDNIDHVESQNAANENSDSIEETLVVSYSESESTKDYEVMPAPVCSPDELRSFLLGLDNEDRADSLCSTEMVEYSEN